MKIDLLDTTGFLSEEEIVNAKVRPSIICGVYFLIKNNRVVYVGQSTDVANRVPAHGDKDFDRVSAININRAMLDVVESLYIHCMEPELNSVQHAPLNREAVLELLLRSNSNAGKELRLMLLNTASNVMQQVKANP